mgnify:CR=1 FL=1
MQPLIILGTGLAGYTLAREFRKLDAERPLWLITQDDGRSYSKPMLSNGLSKGKSAADLGMASAEDMAKQLNATVRANTEVFAIDRAARTDQARQGRKDNQRHDTRLHQRQKILPTRRLFPPRRFRRFSRDFRSRQGSREVGHGWETLPLKRSEGRSLRLGSPKPRPSVLGVV